MSNLDREYLERRRRESLARAQDATDPAIARIHREFAAGYERKLTDQPAPVQLVSPL